MQIAYFSSAEPGEIDRVLVKVSAAARRAEIAITGTVQPAPADGVMQKCEIVLQLLPDGPIRNVSLDLGPGVIGCRLDMGALEEAALIIEDRVPTARALIVNKFGKQEAVGRGLVTAIGLAAERGLPVLVGVSPEYLEAFLAFAEGQAKAMPADASTIFDWLCSAVTTAA